MNRFLSWFYEYETSELVDRINEYAERHGLKIISISTNANQHGAIVLFEGNKPKLNNIVLKYVNKNKDGQRED